MREYFNKKDASKKNYRTDRFFIQNETPKVLVQDSKFATDAQNLAKFELNQIYVEFDTLVVCARVDDVGEILKRLDMKFCAILAVWIFYLRVVGLRFFIKF